MSDIDLSNLDWLLEVFWAICVIAPPVVVGLLFLLIGRFVKGRRDLFRILYFIISIVTSIAASWW